MTPEELSQFDGSDPSKPVYVAVKGMYFKTRRSLLGVIFDVSPRREMYGKCKLLCSCTEKGRGYSVFAGKDASRGLGMSSLNPENAVADYSTLTPEQLKVLEDWVCRICTNPFSLNITRRYLVSLQLTVCSGITLWGGSLRKSNLVFTSNFNIRDSCALIQHDVAWCFAMLASAM